MIECWACNRKNLGRNPVLCGVLALSPAATGLRLGRFAKKYGQVPEYGWLFLNLAYAFVTLTFKSNFAYEPNLVTAATITQLFPLGLFIGIRFDSTGLWLPTSHIHIYIQSFIPSRDYEFSRRLGSARLMIGCIYLIKIRRQCKYCEVVSLPWVE